MSKRGQVVAAVAIVALAVSLSGCSNDDVPGGKGVSLTIGSLGTTENELLAHIYGQALEADGFTVDYNPGVGTRARSLESMQEGMVDLVPEYSGPLLATLDMQSQTTSPDGVIEELPAALGPLGLAVLNPSQAESTRAFVTTREFVNAHSLISIGDLAPFASAITIGGPEGFESLEYGRRALEDSYGVSDWSVLEGKTDAAILSDLLTNRTEVAILPRSSPGVADHKLAVLSDPAFLLPPSTVIPVIPARKYSPELERIVNDVSAALTSQDLAQLNGSVGSRGTAGRKLSIPVVAEEWLQRKGFIEPVSR